MTQEQREHIATTIGMLDAVSALLMNQQMMNVATAIGDQCEILQQLLDNDREVNQ